MLKLLTETAALLLFSLAIFYAPAIIVWLSQPAQLATLAVVGLLALPTALAIWWNV
jgi:hypothetical protein